MTIAVTVLFLTMVAALTMYLLIWQMDRESYRCELYRQSFSSYVALTITVSGRFLNGFAHAYITAPWVQLSLLLLVNVAGLVLVSRISRVFLSKRSVCCTAWILLCKTLLNACLLL